MMVWACTQTIIHKTNKTTNVVGSTSQYKTAQNKKERLKTSLLRGATGIRTRDTRIFSPLLYQLSYGTIICALLFVSECKDKHIFFICKFFRKKLLLFFSAIYVNSTQTTKGQCFMNIAKQTLFLASKLH